MAKNTRYDTSHFLALLDSLRHRAKESCGDFHCLEFARDGIKNTLFDDICSPRPARVAHGVASGVTKRGLFAGFNANASHEAERIMMVWAIVNVKCAFAESFWFLVIGFWLTKN
jgi:hypothetical protein